MKSLLERVNFNPLSDRVLLVGDLVNRGPDSLSVLRWAKDLGQRHAVVVLGNHDLYLISRYLGVKSPNKKEKDTLLPVLNAPDCHEIIEWLRNQPLAYKEGKNIIVHAGILPSWTVKEALENAALAESYIKGNLAADLLEFWSSYHGRSWRKSLSKIEKAAVALNVFTRMRTVSSAKTMNLSYSGKPKAAPEGLVPWFKHPDRAITKHRVIFGHWAALGYKNNKSIIALDTGCVWGGWLTAYCLDDDTKISLRSIEKKAC